MTHPFDTLWINARLVTCNNGYGIIDNAAIASKDQRIAWLGPMEQLPDQARALAPHIIDAKQRCITPGLIDCHTHLVFAGNRANEFARRLQGESYANIAASGGGIQSTVRATRELDETELLQQSLPRAKALMDSGARVLEIKSGYGLDLETECKMLRVAGRIGETLAIPVRRTFLGAHAVPPEYQGNADNYIRYICNELIPLVAREKLADSVDVFCEHIAFSLQQTREVFACAEQYQLAIKCHAEQLSNMGAAALAAEFGALSADHLEYIDEQGVTALASSGTVAVLLPGAYYFLRESKTPPVALLRKHQVPMAIASDCNPGTSPVTSLKLIMNMACVLFALTPEEAMLGVTLNAAKALGMEQSHGSLSVGKCADIVLWDVNHPDELSYTVG